MGEAARKIMGDVPISYIEGVGGTRVSEDDIVAVGKHDVSFLSFQSIRALIDNPQIRSYRSRLVDKLMCKRPAFYNSDEKKR